MDTRAIGELVLPGAAVEDKTGWDDFEEGACFGRVLEFGTSATPFGSTSAAEFSDETPIALPNSVASLSLLS
jgi:hypothetical protein